MVVWYRGFRGEPWLRVSWNEPPMWFFSAEKSVVLWAIFDYTNGNVIFYLFRGSYLAHTKLVQGSLCSMFVQIITRLILFVIAKLHYGCRAGLGSLWMLGWINCDHFWICLKRNSIEHSQSLAGAGFFCVQGLFKYECRNQTNFIR